MALNADLRGAIVGRVLSVALLGLLPALSGCLQALPVGRFEGGAPTFDPMAFFVGQTSSSGVLETRSGAPSRRLHVEGSGRELPDGSLRLDQQVSLDQARTMSRTWVLRRVDQHHYAGTLTDAAGPVRAEAYGDAFHVQYALKAPLGGRMEQWLYLQPDGRTVVNEATVRVLGVVAAHLSERITRAGPGL